MANAIFLFVLALFIHFILLSSNKYNWIEGDMAGAGVASHQEALPPERS